MPEAVPHLLAFAGSLRQGSHNRRLIHVLAEGAREAGAEVTLIELRDFPLPIYDGDIEADGMPGPVRELQALMAAHEGLLVSTPEYNGSMPALVKNTLDWISRPTTAGGSGVGIGIGLSPNGGARGRARWRGRRGHERAPVPFGAPQ